MLILGRVFSNERPLTGCPEAAGLRGLELDQIGATEKQAPKHVYPSILMAFVCASREARQE